MANTPVNLQDCNRFPGEQLRNIDQLFDRLAHSADPEAMFDQNIEAANTHENGAQPGKDEMYATMRVGAATGAMILRAEADLPGARPAWKQRHRAVSDVMARRGSVLQGMLSTLGDETTGSGSILALYLATNAADDAPDYSVWQRRPAVGVVNRVREHRGTAPDYAAQASGNAETWNSDHMAEACRGYLVRYLARDHNLHAKSLEATLAGAYGAVVLRKGSLVNYRDTGDVIDSRHLEDFVSACLRLLNGRGEAAVFGELNPTFALMFQLGRHMLQANGVKVRRSHGLIDGAVQAGQAARGFFGTTTVKVHKPAPAAPGEPPRAPMAERLRAERSGATAPAAGTTATPAKKAAPAAAPGAGGTTRPTAERRARRGFIDRRLTHMLTGSLEPEIDDMLEDPQRYPHWARLYAATLLRISGRTAQGRESTLIAKNRDVMSKMTLAELLRAGTIDAIAARDEIPEDHFAAAIELQRWLRGIATGHREVNGLTREAALTNYQHIQEALTQHVRRVFEIPEDQVLTPNLLAGLAELRLVDLSRALEEPEMNQPFLIMMLRRIQDAFFGVQERDLPYGTEGTFMDRVRGNLDRAGVQIYDLPPVAQARYRALLAGAGWKGASVPDRPPIEFPTAAEIGEKLKNAGEKAKETAAKLKGASGTAAAKVKDVSGKLRDGLDKLFPQE
ncbi:MAG TPA: hypothetical protein VLH86_00075 [Patescibacteria group bacterium]|nr:hypothetical protein [Patescibacteria group bacterium]